METNRKGNFVPMDKAGFFEPETRSGYFVSIETKLKWGKEIEILEEFDRVCNLFGFRYFAFGGTLLGTIRHHGFIPWDDDIDVCLFRDDYDKLLSVGPSAFRPPYFFQSSDTDYIGRGHVELRNNQTTGYMQCDYRAPYNKGMFIDIFPLDFVDSDTLPKALANLEPQGASLLQFPRRRESLKHPFLAWCYNAVVYPLQIIRYHVLGGDKARREQYHHFEKSCSSYPGTATKVCALEYYAIQHEKKPPLLDASAFRETTYCNFEFFKMPCPQDYDVVLKEIFGNYMVPVRAPARHDSLFLDTKVSYSVYDQKIKSFSQFMSLFSEPTK